MLCRLLGPVEVRAGESWTGVSAPKWRALLAVLALRPGQVVSTGQLAGELWSDDPPPGARKLVSGYVAALRRLAGDPDGRVLVTQAPGYRLMVASADLDVSRFEELVAAGRSALERADGARAAEFLAAALALWRGPALAGVPRGPLIAAEAARLDELQVDALELRAEAGICCGRAPELVAELRQLTAGHPLRERFWHQLMRALEHAGRPAQALEAYEQARKILAEELGADPGPDLQQLHRRLLAGDPAPAARPAAAPPPVAAIAPVAVQNHRPLGAPRQLPVSVRHFTGRDRELRTLQALLGGIDGDVGTVLIGIISGTAGVGKTTLAVHFAYQIAGQFPDGQLYVNLRGFDPSGIPVAPAEIIRGFLDALQVPQERIPALPDAQAAMYRSIMAGKRMLIVLDNARDAEQVRPLLPPSPGSLVLVTSRSQLLSLTVAEHACLLTMDLLTVSEARQLLALRLGEKTTRGNQQATDELITRCARLPLALSIVAARAAAEATQPLSNLAEQLRDIQERLDVLNAGDLATDIRAVFSCSYQSLSAPAARMFRLLGVHPGPDISVPAAASLSGLPVESARRILRELTSAHLLTERIPGRFAFHDLLRVYASEQVPDAERRPAIHRILDHYVYAGHTAALLIDPARRPLSLPPAQPRVSPQHHADLQQAVTWFQAERDVLLRVIGQAETAGFDAHAWQIPWTLASFLQQWGHWPDYIATQQAALAAAQHLGDLFREADTHYNLALAFGLAGLNDRAYAHMSRSLALHQQLSDPVRASPKPHRPRLGPRVAGPACRSARTCTARSPAAPGRGASSRTARGAQRGRLVSRSPGGIRADSRVLR